MRHERHLESLVDHIVRWAESVAQPNTIGAWPLRGSASDTSDRSTWPEERGRAHPCISVHYGYDWLATVRTTKTGKARVYVAKGVEVRVVE